ncbi:hypothetical protein M0813_28414 [Anaeramoeba flamelloides]|uniref:Transmembrane protein n=1 Tax=Anaeramoeba flamelloides TaxID=1746091 RepID=A0ABQ8XTW3_9EUKA|nr:hypothetical protein M0813_28414 [Anaeramoeba flamelloides]
MKSKLLQEIFSDDSFSEEDEPNQEERPSFFQRYFIKQLNKAFLSTLFMLIIMTMGIIFTQIKKQPNQQDHKESKFYFVGEIFLQIGLFGFAGGFTNWVAVKMLFDKIPFLYGSGVIPRKYQELSLVIKDVVMKNFFNSVCILSFFFFYLLYRSKLPQIKGVD